jgi:HEPN domain-containing protein
MTLAVREWVEKAEGDFRSAAREMRARKAPNYDLSCFCAQQCAEKYLKAVLQPLGLAVPRTHDLPKLLASAVPRFPELRLLQSRLEALAAYAVDFRYPGTSATKALAQRAYQDCATVRGAIRVLLKLPTGKTAGRQATR